MDETEISVARAHRLFDLIEPATVSRDHLSAKQAARHLTEGFNRRVMMLESSLRYIESTIPDDGGEPLSTYDIPELAVHVNALWMNLCGALDNLAWAVAYEMKVIDPLSERPGEGRDLVGLGKKPFLDRLERIDDALAAELRRFLPWQKELRDLRDPAAHRIPIYPTPGVLKGEAAEKAQELMSQANAVMMAGNTHEGLELIHRANSLAAYEPWIVLSHEGRLEPRHLTRQMHSDIDQFINTSKLVLNRLFRDTPGYRAI